MILAIQHPLFEFVEQPIFPFSLNIFNFKNAVLLKYQKWIIIATTENLKIQKKTKKMEVKPQNLGKLEEEAEKQKKLQLLSNKEVTNS